MKRCNHLLPIVSGLFLVLCAPSVVRAQDPTSPPPATAGVVATSRARSGAGFGVGAAAFLSGLTGVEAVYDQSIWHAEALFGFNTTTGAGPGDATVTQFQFGARGWYHLHTGTSSDFSLGGGAGVMTSSGGGQSLTAILLEPGMLARAFLTPNFALHVMAGLSMVFGDSVTASTTTGFRLASQFLGGFGFTYFFR